MRALIQSKHPAVYGDRQPGAIPLAAVFLILLAPACALAQDIVMSPPKNQLVAPILREKDVPPPLSRPPAPPETPFKIGSFAFRPRLAYSYMNAEGLPAKDGRRVASEIHRFAPGLTADLGEHWTFDYSPTSVSYTARAMEDTFDQSFGLDGAATFRDWDFHFAESFAEASPTLVETGQQTHQKTWSTSLNTSYSFSPKVQFQASGGLNERYTDISPDTRTWTSKASCNLVFSPRLNLNLGMGYDYNEITAAADNSSASYTVGLNWQPAPKLTIGMSMGMQHTHSTSSAAVDLSSPIPDFNVSYQPFETTTLTVTASRTVSPSYYQDQVTESYRWSVSLSQRLLGRFYLSANYSPYETDYRATDATTTTERRDSVKMYSVRLSTQLFDRLRVAAVFTETDNKSNQAGFSFSSKQYGVELSYSY